MNRTVTIKTMLIVAFSWLVAGLLAMGMGLFSMDGEFAIKRLLTELFFIGAVSLWSKSP